MVVAINKRKITIALLLLFVLFLPVGIIVGFSNAATFPADPGDNGEQIGVGCGGFSSDSFNASGSTEGWSSVLTKSRNMSVDEGYKDVEYAKPGDTVRFKHCYFPGAQKTASTSITASHNHPGIVANSGATTQNMPYTNLAALSTEENKSRVHNWVPNDGNPQMHTPNYPAEFDDGHYSYIPNFSRVTSLYGYYGGLNIFNNVPYLNPGAANIAHANNDYTVGQDVMPGVGKYTEYHKIVASNHVKIWEATEPNRPWSCKYSVDKNDCWTGEYVKVWQDVTPHCNKTVPSAIPGTEQERCTRGGGEWITRELVDSTTKIYGNTDEHTYSGGVCYKNATCNHPASQKYIVYDVNIDTKGGAAPVNDEASIIVPYNFTVTGSAKFGDDVKQVYAGESIQLNDFKIELIDRKNRLGEYATEAPLIKGQLFTFIANNSDGSNRVTDYRAAEEKTKSGGLTPSKRVWDSIYPSMSVTIDDMEAGKYFCVMLKYYPTDSGVFENYTDAKGSHAWGETKPSCKPIAKRPSFQIWGGSLFSNGKIDAVRTQKNHLLGVNSYSATSANGAYVFGPWGELGVMVLGTNTSLASSSALGGSNGKYETNPKDGLCDYESVLTFANNDTQGSTICNDLIRNLNGEFGGGTKVSVDKKRLIDDMITHDGSNTIEFPPDETNSVGIVVGQPRTYASYLTANKKLVRYSYSKNANITIGASTITKGSINEVLEDESISEEEVGTTYIIHSDKTVTIGGNILFESGTSKSFDELSKVVIYAENINILCQVKTVDAILIAENEIKTCTDWTGKVPNVNDVSRSIPLRINGAVIADKISFDRTFGASAGPNREEDGIEKGSGVPAEVINYDTTLLLWGRAQADTSASGKVNETFTRELAPRY